MTEDTVNFGDTQKQSENLFRRNERESCLWDCSELAGNNITRFIFFCSEHVSLFK